MTRFEDRDRESTSNRAALVLAATAVLAMLVTQIAFAGPAGEGAGPTANASGSTKKQLKKLKKRVNRLTRLITGPAAGDLTGAYPNLAIGAGRVNSGKVADNSLTGADIAESSLGPVPQAQSASNVNGVRVKHFEFKANFGAVETLLTTQSDGMALIASCDSTPGFGLVVTAGTTFNNAVIKSYSVDTVSGAVGNRINDDDFDIAESTSFDLLVDGQDQIGHTAYTRPNALLRPSREVSLEWMGDENSLGFDCVFFGKAMISA